MVNTGVKRTGPYDPKAVVPRAYHVEVAESEADWVAELLQRDYSSGQHMFPMGIKMRFVPDVNQLINFNTRTKTAQPLLLVNWHLKTKCRMPTLGKSRTSIRWAVPG